MEHLSVFFKPSVSQAFNSRNLIYFNIVDRDLTCKSQYKIYGGENMDLACMQWVTSSEISKGSKLNSLKQYKISSLQIECNIPEAYILSTPFPDKISFSTESTYTNTKKQTSNNNNNNNNNNKSKKKKERKILLLLEKPVAGSSKAD